MPNGIHVRLWPLCGLSDANRPDGAAARVRSRRGHVGCVRRRKVGGVTEFDGLPLLRSPVAIAAFEGWNDAADASTAAVEHLEQVWQAREITDLDPEEFYDFQVSRPTITMAEGETRQIEWPTTRFVWRARPAPSATWC